eukprot:CFRG3149T1
MEVDEEEIVVVLEVDDMEVNEGEIVVVSVNVVVSLNIDVTDCVFVYVRVWSRVVVNTIVEPESGTVKVTVTGTVVETISIDIDVDVGVKSDLLDVVAVVLYKE